MKFSRALPIAVVCVVLVCACGNGSNDKSGKNEQKKDPQKTENTGTEQSTESNTISGDNSVISYKLTGALNGKMTIYRNGKELKQIIESEIMGMQNRNEIFVKENTVYSITELGGKKMATKTAIDNYNNSKPTGETIADTREFERLLNARKVTGNEQILGYDCEIYEVSDNTFLSVANKQLILKIKSPQLIAEATEVSLLPSGDGSIFELPAGVNFRTVKPNEAPSKEKLDSMMKELKK